MRRNLDRTSVTLAIANAYQAIDYAAGRDRTDDARALAYQAARQALDYADRGLADAVTVDDVELRAGVRALRARLDV